MISRRLRHPGLEPGSIVQQVHGLEHRGLRLRHDGPRLKPVPSFVEGAGVTGGTAGFTLVEVLISLLIFGLLAAAGVTLLSFSVKAQGATAAKLDEDSAIARLSSALTADLAQAVPRATRREGGERLPPFTGEAAAGSGAMLRFVRGGWSNLDGVARASAQKVEYGVQDGALTRTAYPMLDGAAPLPPAAMLDQVEQVALRYRIKGAWSDRWSGSPETPLPDALELRIRRTGGTEYRQLYLVGTGYGKRTDAAK